MNAAEPRSRRNELLALALLALFFAFGLFDHSLWAPNDSREGGMIWDAWRSGHWVALTLNGTPFLEKPPLLHWTSLVLCSAFGFINEGLVRLPAAVCGFGAVLIAYRWGARMGSRRAGLLAAFTCATSALVLEYSRIVLTDMCLTFVVALSLELFWLAHRSERAKAWRFALFLLVTSFAFYAKGLLGPGFVMASVVVFLASRREWRLLLILPPLFFVTLFAAIWPWALALQREGGREYLIQAFVDNQLGRFLSLPSDGQLTSLPIIGRFLGFMAGRPLPDDPYLVHKEPLYYYLLELPGPLLPWTLLVPPSLVHWFTRRTTQPPSFQRFLSCSFVTMAAVLHLSSAKVGCYALPLFPLIFVMVGRWCDESFRVDGARVARVLIRWSGAFLRGAALTLAVVYLLLFALPRGLDEPLSSLLKRWGADVGVGNPSELAWTQGGVVAWRGAALAAAAVALVAWKFRKKLVAVNGEFELVRPIAITIVVLMLGASAITPVYDHQRSYKPIATLVRNELTAGRQVALALDAAKEVGEFIFYADARMPEVAKSTGIRAFLTKDERPRGVVVHADELDEITKQLAGVDFSVRTVAADAGQKSREFCLLTRG